jgi:hypothetical protein
VPAVLVAAVGKSALVLSRVRPDIAARLVVGLDMATALRRRHCLPSLGLREVLPVRVPVLRYLGRMQLLGRLLGPDLRHRCHPAAVVARTAPAVVVHLPSNCSPSVSAEGHIAHCFAKYACPVKVHTAVEEVVVLQD